MPDSTLADLPEAVTLDDDDILYVVTDPSGAPADRKATVGTVRGEELYYRHVQGVASAIWTVTHNLGRRPGGVSVVSSTGDEVTGEVQHLSDNQMEIRFSASFSGEAYLS